jgi:ATP-dependent exoDNAse (exonuclease V) alpha subunit
MSTTAPASPPVPGFLSHATFHRLTVDQYHEMIRNGILGEDDPVELLEGYLVTKMPRSPEHDYAIQAGRTLHLREGDHVMIRLNDRQQRMHEGLDVLNGYRGVVERIDDEQHVHVVWQRQSEDGYEDVPARLSPDFIAAGGLSLGYAMTTHKAEGLTVTADWDLPTGEHQGGTVLAYGPGMDTAGTHVATSRHADKMFLFASDYPHWQFDGDSVLPEGFSPDLVRKIMVDNPHATYPRLKQPAAKETTP